MTTPKLIPRALACGVALAISSYAVAQMPPRLPEPRPMPSRPTNPEPPKPPERQYVNTGVNVGVNTTRRARFDIKSEKLHDIELTDVRTRGNMLRADELTFSVVLMNTGSQTFAFAGNQIDASIIEGHFDYRQRVNVDRRQVPYYPARGDYDITVRTGSVIELPIIIRGQRTQKVGLWPVPSRMSPMPGLRAVKLSSGNAPIEIRPDVWYTIDARLTPSEKDEVEHEHSVFLNVRFNRAGQIAEQQGPFLY
ncbi:MAG: hypothetical protein QNJ00_07090 [Woeseiaceae bacterium]|nr:hypothetical protein [Woeseiaceae bacterium]